MLRKLLLIVIVIALGAGGVAYWQFSKLQAIGSTAVKPGSSEPVDFVIARGQSPAAISKMLQDAGLVEDAEQFRLYLSHIAKKANTLQAGEYLLNAGMTGDEIIAALGKGKRKELRFTIPEGLRKEEIAKLIAASGIAKESELLVAMNDAKLVKEFGVPDGVPGGMEGYLYPDTYQFPPNTSAEKVVRRMRARLDEVITDEMKARMKEMDWPLHRVLTLAAIVEKETGQKHERPHIASVFHNRIKRDMKMQTDPTVIYGIKNYDGNIRRRDLTTHHAYNTYTMKGLPPGPIASPGQAAIKAALWPDKTKDIFFVSKNDGTHIFCPNLACHEAAVQKWQVEYFRNKRNKR